MSSRFAIKTVLVCLVSAMLIGCGGMYVNIPPEPGDVAQQNPNNARVRALLARAFEAVIDDANLEGPVRLELPEATTSLTHAAVADEVSKALSPDEEGEATATLTATGVRIRGTQGEVDIRRPAGPDGDTTELTTVYAHWDTFIGWTVSRVRVWRGVQD